MSKELTAIQKILKANSTKDALAAQQNCVRMPVLNELAKEFKSSGFELVKELWDAGAYEEKMIAAKMLGCIAKKDANKSLKLIQYFTIGIDNWAICDTIGMQSLKPILKTHQQEIFALAKKYNRSTNFWERRLSLVLVEWYTRMPELHTEIKKLIASLENDTEYYVRKAVVWINKNFDKGK
jgi:3-methyladenine DNA glycosylase AlkD